MQANDKCDEQESGHDKVGILEEGIGSPLLPELANILRDLTIARPEEALHDYENCEQDWSGSTAQRKHFLNSIWLTGQCHAFAQAASPPYLRLVACSQRPDTPETGPVKSVEGRAENWSAGGGLWSCIRSLREQRTEKSTDVGGQRSRDPPASG